MRFSAPTGQGRIAQPTLSRSYPLSVTAACALALAGCTAGPDFVRPAPPSTTGYVAGAAPTRTATTAGRGGEAQYFLPGQALPRGWWGWFGSPEINAMIADAFRQSPSLDAARARLRGAEATLRARRALRSPEVSAQGSVNYGTSGGGGGAGQQAGGGQSFVIYTASLPVRYDFDIARRNRRIIEVARAQFEQGRQQLQAAYLTLAGNIVSTALDAAALRAQIGTREEVVAGQDRRIRLIRVQVQEGYAARAALVTAEAEVAALRAQIPVLRAQLAATENALAQLIGRPPAEAGIPPIDLDRLRLPQTVPIALPAQLARSRPDILASEALLAAASAQVGVAEADLFPNLTLDGSAGLFGIDKAISTAFDLGSALVAPIFDGGRRRAERDVAVAAYQEALGNYRSDVLAALVQVANGIRALENDALALREQSVALAAARESFDLALFQEREGALNPVEVLVQQRAFQEARFAYVEALARRFQDTAALFAALGPGPIDAAGLRSVTAAEQFAFARAELGRERPAASVGAR